MIREPTHTLRYTLQISSTIIWGKLAALVPTQKRGATNNTSNNLNKDSGVSLHVHRCAYFLFGHKTADNHHPAIGQFIRTFLSLSTCEWWWCARIGKRIQTFIYVSNYNSKSSLPCSSFLCGLFLLFFFFFLNFGRAFPFRIAFIFIWIRVMNVFSVNYHFGGTLSPPHPVLFCLP